MMVKRLIVLAAFLSACTEAAPPIGETREITNVYFPPAATNAVVIESIAESPPALVLRAEEGGVTCESVSVITADGALHEIYSGAIALDESVRAEIPGDIASFGRIALTCQSDDPERALLHLDTEIPA